MTNTKENKNSVTIRLTDEQESMIREILFLKVDMKMNKTHVFEAALLEYYNKIKRA